MTDKDIDIIKAFECCEKNKDDCTQCDYWPVCIKADDMPFFLPELLRMFNLKQAEIGRLQSMNNAKLDTIHDLQTEIEKLKIENQSLRMAANSYKLHYNEARAEAVKEFAERLRETKFKYGSDYVIYAENIDVLVKELEGETE
ncbi:MAG: hypothetical protein ACI4IM_00475 [Acutalibacteraceae bacterium]